ncbi:hypothetical protein G8770_09775 [Aestuariicella hydrocarbonica]|uniref:PEP-CTERM sorting domain-containing protein n=1 Tax=Pseudomaricurvus hydrocarbonicus TaxID=1470433 RepID=A0A9E5JVU7_9GAMM|nr:hypothetical protein [Aestuariicella hydrocarbonica]NHO65830.1 hypothetical protein [Aestuariicella hydrocarbonica]
MGLFLGLFTAVAANAAMIVANLEDVTNGGGFYAQVTVSDIVGGVKVTADIASPINPGLTQGDILGLGFQIADESLLPLTIANNGNEDPSGIITGECQIANGCDLFHGGVGSLGTGFDITIALGLSGSPAGLVQTLMFEMFGAGLTASEFATQAIGMRVQSLEGVLRTYTAASSKLIGDGPPGRVPVPGTLALFGAALLAFRFASSLLSRCKLSRRNTSC